jgi:small subunit ribosomal protein S16
MLRLRLQRRGKRNYATYRLVVADQHAPIKGKFVADVGHYNPHSSEFEIKEEEVTAWMAKGAQPTATVHNLLVDKGFLKKDKVTSWSPKKKQAKDEEDEKPEQAAEPAAETSKDKEPTEDKPSETDVERATE